MKFPPTLRQVNLCCCNKVCTLFFLFFFFSTSHYAQNKSFAPESLAYLLQAEGLGKSRKKVVRNIATCSRDLIILDYSFDGSDEEKWTKNELISIKQGKKSRKVIAYISIGEAENYRFYWQKKWDRNGDGKPDKKAPLFLNGENPDWEGNYKVRYWHQAWQKIIFSYLDKILAQGFDGIYLDIIDAFEFYEYKKSTKEWLPHRKNPKTGNTYREDMIAWVQKITKYTQQKNPNFLIIPQNGSQLLESLEYQKTIDGIGIEDLFTDGHKKQKAASIATTIKRLKKFKKPVCIIEYAKKKNLHSFAREQAKHSKFTLLITTRELDSFGN